MISLTSRPFRHSSISQRDRHDGIHLPRLGRARWRGGLIALLIRLLGVGLCAFGAAQAYALDVNTATVTQLETLKGVGPRTAQMIVQERERAGAYESLEDLSDRVRGIGRKRLARLREAGLTTGGPSTLVITPGSIAAPHFAPALPPVTPVPAGTPLPAPLPAPR